MSVAELVGVLLFVERAELVGGSFWHNGRTDNKTEVELDCHGRHVEKARGKMESIVDGGGSTVWCGFLSWCRLLPAFVES
jgi:hypothetical protein